MPMARNSELAFPVNGVSIGEPETTAVRRRRHCSGAALVVTRPSSKTLPVYRRWCPYRAARIEKAKWDRKKRSDQEIDC